MLNVGIIGFGGMGHVHASAYLKRQDVRLVAIADELPERLDGKSMTINVGTTGAIDLTGVRTYSSADDMLAAGGVDLVSICLPTDLHAAATIKALEAGCHVFCEKPMSRTLAEADAVIAAQKRGDRTLMIGQCLRFWPAYEHVIEAQRSGCHGKLLMLSMRRVSPCPGWGRSGAHNWFPDGRRSGGALLDLHIHDTDFANHLLGVPQAVVTVGATYRSGAIDNAVTQYMYDGKTAVTAETSWSYGGGFRMALCAIFEEATLEMGYRNGDLVLMRDGGAPEKVELADASGYEREIGYLIDCIVAGREPERCLPFSTRETMRIAFAEERSALAGGQRVAL